MTNQVNWCFWYKSYYYMANKLPVGVVESAKPTDPTLMI